MAGRRMNKPDVKYKSLETNRRLLDVFVTQRQSHLSPRYYRNGNKTLFMAHNILYSYDLPLAQRCSKDSSSYTGVWSRGHVNRDPVFLVTNEELTCTTAGHMRELRAVVQMNYDVRFYFVPNIFPETVEEHRDNLECLLAYCDGLAVKWQRGRSAKEVHAVTLRAHVAHAMLYADTFLTEFDDVFIDPTLVALRCKRPFVQC